jgi:hypothetical protein
MTQCIKTSLNELWQLRGRIDRQALAEGDWPLVGAMVSQHIARTEARLARMLEKLEAIDAAEGKEASSGSDPEADRAGDSDGSRDGGPPSNANATDSNHTGSGSSEGATARRSDAPDPKPKPKGHGRNGLAAYSSAKHIFHDLALGIIGKLCETCRIGRMSKYREKVIIRIVGQPLFGAEAHHYEQGRCKNCGKIVKASGPAGILEGFGTSYITYDWSACAMLIVMHYFAGGPFKRLESLHKGWGVPMPDANQWSIVDACSGLLAPLLKALEQHGIRYAVNLRIDDTGSMIISLRQQIQAEIAALASVGASTKDVRTGINATGVYLTTHEGAVIVLIYTGRHHAGEIIDQLLKHRESSQPKLAKVTDGASKNFDHAHEDQLIEATCNAHAFLKFRAIKDKYPAEYAIAGEVYKQVFDNDDETEARGLTPVERMLYHREHSKPLMERLRAMCEDRIKSKLVEPSSLLWEPLTFIINQWSRLTKFYQEPNVPLDSNLVEQTLIIPVRYLVGSFNYKNLNGSEVGDLSMSLIASARANDVEPVAYLTYCLRNHEDLARRPEYYLPWVYQKRLKESEMHPAPEPRGGAPQPSP